MWSFYQNNQEGKYFGTTINKITTINFLKNCPSHLGSSKATPIGVALPDNSEMIILQYVYFMCVILLGPSKTSNPLSDKLTKFGLLVRAPA